MAVSLLCSALLCFAVLVLCAYICVSWGVVLTLPLSKHCATSPLTVRSTHHIMQPALSPPHTPQPSNMLYSVCVCVCVCVHMCVSERLRNSHTPLVHHGPNSLTKLHHSHVRILFSYSIGRSQTCKVIFKFCKMDRYSLWISLHDFRTAIPTVWPKGSSRDSS